MKIVIHVFDDRSVDIEELRNLVASVASQLKLTAKGIDVCVFPPTQITDIMTLQACCREADEAVKDGHIFFVDLCLASRDLSEKVLVSEHRRQIPDPDLVLDWSDSDLSRTAGGLLLAWHVLTTAGSQNLLVFASGQSSEDFTAERVAEMRGLMNGRNAAVPYNWARDNFARVSRERKEDYLKEKISVWLAHFFNPLERIHPKDSELWFSSVHPTMNHTFAHQGYDYIRTLVHYLSCALQVEENRVRAWYMSLGEQIKVELHEYVLCIVGASAACHNDDRAGRRLQWRHLPFLATASAPAPGSLILNDTICGNAASVLRPDAANCDGDLLKLLVGDAEGMNNGVLPHILVDDNTPTVSRLVSCTFENDGCAIEVDYDTTALETNFNECLAKQSEQNDHDSANALFRLQSFLQKHGVEVKVLPQKIIIKRVS